MKQKKEKRIAGRKFPWKKVIKASVIIAGCAGLILCGLSMYGKYQMSKISSLSFQEALKYTTKDNDEAIITVGTIQEDKVSYVVYGANGKVLPQELHTYEIGSLTKTFTAAMISKAVREDKIDLTSSIDQYITLPEASDYPTIAELLTHTSGYKGYYFEKPMVSNFFRGRNDFYGITKEMVIKKAGKISLPDTYGFNYSNYGYAVLGIILENVYGCDYKTLMNQFLKNELNLPNTQISEQNGDLGKYWDWNDDDAYLAAGAITSNIADMLTYAQMQLDQYEYLENCQVSLKEVDVSNEQYEMMGIHVDEIGMAWIVDSENHIIWHNGGTGHYNSYLGFDPQTDTAVIILSNCPPNYRIPATVLGAKVFQELRQ